MINRPFLISLLSCLSWLHWNVAAAAEDEPRSALILYGSTGIANWNQNFNNALREHIGSDWGQYFTPEFLSLVSATAAERELIARSLALRYSEKDIDLVVAVLPEANSFVHDWAHIFAPGAATLHVLPGSDVLAEAGHQSSEAYIVSAIDEAVSGTMALLPRVLPDLPRLYVVSGVSTSDAIYLERFQATLHDTSFAADVVYLRGLPPEEMVATLQDAPAESAILFITYDMDRTGREWAALTISQALVENTDLPVFTFADSLPAHGALGGFVTSVDSYAAASAAIIRDMVDGIFPIEPVTADPVYLFNGEQLDRFDVNRRLLPAGSLIVNDPPNLWRDYRWWIVGGLVVFAIQLLLIALLLASMRRRRAAEAELRRTQKLEALGSLAGGIAHDFNNTLMAIVANTELAMEDRPGDEELQDQLGNVLAASRRARNMVRQILMFSRQAVQQSATGLDTETHLKECVSQLHSALSRRCRVELQCASPLAPVIFDATQLHQVLLNVCVNAEQAMVSGGVITIQARNETVDWTRNLLNQRLPPGDYVRISISDSGNGISAENLRRVFEPFFSTKPPGQGTGLGLTLAYQIMKTHRGYIDLASQPGHGTRVTLYLKAATDQASVPEPRQHARPARGNDEPILLVDDDVMVLDTTRRLLESLGYRVHAYASSVEALQCFQKGADSFRLIYSDLSMPEMDGVRLITRARRLRPDIPVILCTGYQESADASELENCRILLKPVGAMEIAKTVADALNATASPAT